MYHHYNDKNRSFQSRNNSTRTIKRTVMNKPYIRHGSRYKSPDRLVPIKQLDESRLDALSINELEQLKGLIEEKQEEKRAQTQSVTFFAHFSSKPYSLEKYSSSKLGLREYVGEAREPKHRIRDRIPRLHEKIFLHKEDIMGTDLIFKYRQCLDGLSRQESQDIIGDRIFSLSNSPSLAFTAAIVDETCIYIKYHYVHDLPVNTQDIFMYTATVMKFEFFNKMNMVKLPCILNDNGHGDIEYRIVRQLCGKPVLDRRMPNTEYEIQHRAPGTFRHPVQQAMSIITTFGRIIREMKEKMLQTNEPQFLREYDKERVCEFYDCGMITRLITDQLKNHECDDLGCQSRIKRIMLPWRPSLFFCSYLTKDAPDLNLDISLPDEVPNLQYNEYIPKMKKYDSLKKCKEREKVKLEKPFVKEKSKVKDSPIHENENVSEKNENQESSTNEEKMDIINEKDDESINEKENDSISDELDTENEMDLDYDEETGDTDINDSYSEDSE